MPRPVIPSKSSAKLLEVTRNMLGIYGWVQGESYRCHRGYSLPGALYSAAYRDGEWAHEVHAYALGQLVTAAYSRGWGKASPFTLWQRLTAWNDKEGRTVEEVLALLGKARLVKL